MFYGWRIVLACIPGLALSWPVLTIYTFSPFVIPLSTEFGWDRAEISFALTVALFTGVVVSVILGVIVDKFGIKRVVLPSIVLFAITFSSLYWLTDSLFHFYVTYFLIVVVGSGTSVLVFSRLIFNWFDIKRGLALGIAMSGVGIGSAILPLVANYFIVEHSWRMAYLMLGIMVLFISGGILSLIVRDNPHEMGLQKDGIAARVEKASLPPQIGYTFKQAVCTRPFWLMLVSFFIIGIAINGMLAHFMPILQDRGISAVHAARTLSLLGIAVIIGRIMAGILVDRYFGPYVAIGFMLAPIIGISILALGAKGNITILSALLLGFALGAEFDFIGHFVNRYLGLKTYGLFYGVMLSGFQLGGGIGPVMMGMEFDMAGGYTNSLWIFVAFFVATCLLYLFLGPYPKLPEGEVTQAANSH